MGQRIWEKQRIVVGFDSLSFSVVAGCRAVRADGGAKAKTGVGSPDARDRAGESHIKKRYCSLDVGRNESHSLINKLREQETVEMFREVFEINRSCYYDYR